MGKDRDGLRRLCTGTRRSRGGAGQAADRAAVRMAAQQLLQGHTALHPPCTAGTHTDFARHTVAHTAQPHGGAGTTSNKRRGRAHAAKAEAMSRQRRCEWHRTAPQLTHTHTLNTDTAPKQRPKQCKLPQSAHECTAAHTHTFWIQTKQVYPPTAIFQLPWIQPSHLLTPCPSVCVSLKVPLRVPAARRRLPLQLAAKVRRETKSVHCTVLVFRRRQTPVKRCCCYRAVSLSPPPPLSLFAGGAVLVLAVVVFVASPCGAANKRH